MKILVCITKTPETTAKIAFANGGTEFDTNGVQFIMNPYDEWYALVRALELKETQGGEVVIINVGDSSNDSVIRKGLAIGADKAVRVDASANSALGVAKEIANYAKGEGFDMIFTGKESIDYNSASVGAMLSELLDYPFVSYASKLTMDGNTATIDRDIDGGVEVVEVSTPMVISAAKGLAEQRIPNMRGIMMAKRKPLQVVPSSQEDGHVEFVSFELPDEKSSVTMVDPENMDELVRLLHEEAKAI